MLLRISAVVVLAVCKLSSALPLEDVPAPLSQPQIPLLANPNPVLANPPSYVDSPSDAQSVIAARSLPDVVVGANSSSDGNAEIASRSLDVAPAAAAAVPAAAAAVPAGPVVLDASPNVNLAPAVAIQNLDSASNPLAPQPQPAGGVPGDLVDKSLPNATVERSPSNFTSSFASRSGFSASANPNPNSSSQGFVPSFFKTFGMRKKRGEVLVPEVGSPNWRNLGIPEAAMEASQFEEVPEDRFSGIPENDAQLVGLEEAQDQFAGVPESQLPQAEQNPVAYINAAQQRYPLYGI